LDKPISKGKQFITIHDIENKFVPNVLLIWRASQNHDCNQINSMKKNEWLHEKLIPNLEPNSVTVVFKAS
jgi:uncharacterized protein YllA (UPF0747 family)